MSQLTLFFFDFLLFNYVDFHTQRHVACAALTSVMARQRDPGGGHHIRGLDAAAVGARQPRARESGAKDAD